MKVNNIFINEGNINYMENKVSNNILLDNYIKIYNYQILFMVDVSIKAEQDILKKYGLSKVSILKLAHHGSKTSTSKELLNITNPTVFYYICIY